MFILPHTMKSNIFLEKYDKYGNLIDERKLDNQYSSDAYIDLNTIENNNIISSNRIPFRSYVRNYIICLSSSFSGETSMTHQRIDGNMVSTTRTVFNDFSSNVPIGYDRWGILVGTNNGGVASISSSAVSYSDYTLKSIINHGYESGTIYYGTSIYNKVFTTESYFAISHGRIFTNIYSQPITIKEIGISSILASSISNTATYLMGRDISNYYNSPISISLDTDQSLYIKYSFLLHTSSLLPNRNWMNILDLESDYNGYMYSNTVGLKNFWTYKNTSRTGSIYDGTFNASTCNSELFTVESVISSAFRSLYIDSYNNEKWMILSRTGNSDEIGFAYVAPSQIRDLNCKYLINSSNVGYYSAGFLCRTGYTIGGLSVHFNSSSFTLLSDYDNIITSSTGLSFTDDTNYYIRLYVSHSSVKAKIWTSGSAEPGTWNIDTTTGHITPGYIGIASYDVGTTYYIETYTRFNDFEIEYLEYTQSYLGINPDNMYISKNTSQNTSAYTFLTQVGSYDSAGIVVGSSDNTSSIELIKSNIFSTYDWKLNNQIYNGTTIGTLYYGNMDITSSFYTTSSYIELSRQFVNQNDYTCSIREMGLYLKNTVGVSVVYPNVTRGREMCVGRVSTGVPITLSNGESVIFRIRFNFEI